MFQTPHTRVFVLLSLSLMISRSIHVTTDDISFFFMLSNIPHLYPLLCCQTLGCFHVLAVVNSAGMDTGLVEQLGSGIRVVCCRAHSGGQAVGGRSNRERCRLWEGTHSVKTIQSPMCSEVGLIRLLPLLELKLLTTSLLIRDTL